jgi:acetoin utilization deacetylase AcuC-like enzyme
MLRHRHPGIGHPERPARIIAVQEAIVSRKLHHRIRIQGCRKASWRELARVHDPAFLWALKKEIHHRCGQLDGDTYYSRGSWSAALRAAGCAVEMTAAALADTGNREGFFGVALCRPPGHHAGVASSRGFCLLNNVAVAAAAALARGARRVAVVDWDVHHGNGTQEIFYDSAQVLFLSCHRHPYYPRTGAPEEIGVGPGKGYTVNVPLDAGMGDAETAAVFERVFVPRLLRFDPDLILISAGFDAHTYELLGGLKMTAAGFGDLTRMLCRVAAQVCCGNLVLVLEGGYDKDALAQSLVAVIETALDFANLDFPKNKRQARRGRHSSARALPKSFLAMLDTLAQFPQDLAAG